MPTPAITSRSAWAQGPNYPSYPQLYLENVSGSVIASVGGSYYGVAELDNITISTPGTYFVYVYSGYNAASYQLRVDQSVANVGPQINATPGGSQSNSTLLNVTSPAQGSFGGSVAARAAGRETTGTITHSTHSSPGMPSR